MLELFMRCRKLVTTADLSFSIEALNFHRGGIGVIDEVDMQHAFAAVRKISSAPGLTPTRPS
jgi:hypothetical protein